MADDRTAEFLSLARNVPSMKLHSSTAAASSSPSWQQQQQQQQSRLSTTSSTSPPASLKNNPALVGLQSFHSIAAGISRDIAATSALLQELTQAVRQQQPWQQTPSSSSSSTGFSAGPPVNELVLRIKSNMENLHSRLDQAAGQLQQQQRAWGKNSQAGQQASVVVDGLQAELAVTATGFKKVLQQRTDALQESQDWKRKVYGKSGGPDHDRDDDEEEDDPMPDLSAALLSAPPPVYSSSSALNSFGGLPPITLDLTSSLMATGEATGSTGTISSSLPYHHSALPRPHGITNTSGSSSGYEGEMRQRRGLPSSDAMTPTYAGSYGYSHGAMTSSTTPLTPWEIQQQEQQSGMQEQMQLIPNQDYLQERAQAMSAVEANIVELGTIFNKLAVMVSEHRDMVQRVEDNVEDANANINLSMNVLTDTLTSLRTNRTLALRLFSVLVVFIILFIIFAA